MAMALVTFGCLLRAIDMCCALQLRQSLGFTLVDDLRQLSESLPEEDNGFFPAVYRHYAEVRVWLFGLLA